MKVTLMVNPETTVLSIYSPHNERPEEVTHFYQESSTITNAIPALCLLLIGGDFNAMLGPMDVLFTYNKVNYYNRNGKNMLDFMDQFNLTATTTRFQNRTSKLWTHRRPSGDSAQLDYIISRKKWINSIKNSRAYNSFQGVNSDHRMVSCKCQISYRQRKATVKDPMKGIDWRKVVADDNLCEQYAAAVHNRFAALCDQLEDSDTSATYDMLITANRDVALKMLPKKTKKAPALASRDKVVSARIELKTAAQKHQSKSTRSTKTNIDAAKAALDDAYTEVLG